MLKQLLAFIFAISSTLAFAALDVNKATQDQLIEIKGIGPTTAARILDARAQGPFKSWDDLISRVKGVAPTSAGKFSESGLTVNGQPFKALAPTPTKPQQPAPSENTKPSQSAGKKQEKG